MSIRDDFFANKAVGALWDVAVSIKRGNPLPLDSNSVFASYADLETYAAGVLAYPGQIVAVVNADSTGIYYLDQELAIQEVGKIPSADNKSIEVADGAISMYNFGKYYYKYIPEVKNEETDEVITPAGYEKTEVSDTNVWAAGLEPKVVSEDGELVIGWFEPNPTTADGVQDQVTAVQGTVSDLDEQLNKEGGLVDQVEDLQEEIGHAATEAGNDATGLYAELDKKANAADVYTKTEVDNMVDGLEKSLVDKANSADVYNKTEVYTKSETETAIATAVSAADHLKRKIVESYDAIQTYINEHNDAEQYIFMVPTVYVYTSESNKYDEYIVLKTTDVDNNAVYNIEPVGSWAVDLADYVSEDELAEYLKTYYTQEQVDKFLEAYATTAALETALTKYYTIEQLTAVLEGYYTDDEIDALLVNIYTKTEVDNKFSNYYTKTETDNLLNEKVSKEEGKSLVLDTEIAKLATVEENAEENFIKSVVEEQFIVSEAGQLSLTTAVTNALLTESDKAKLNALVVEGDKVEISGTVNASNVQDLNVWIEQNRDNVTGLLSTEQENKLSAVEKNYINSVDEEVFTVTADRQLLLKAVPADAVTGLSELTETVQDLDAILNGYNDDNGDLVEGLVSIVNSLDDTYVSIVDFNTAVGDLNTLLASGTTLVDRIDELDQRLKWQEMTE